MWLLWPLAYTCSKTFGIEVFYSTYVNQSILMLQEITYLVFYLLLQVPDEESLVGVACGIGACGVRFKKGENLALHRRCHVSNGGDDIFVCSECESGGNRVVGWKAMALHLWNKHQIDTELYSCDQCHFRSFTLSRLQDHKGKKSGGDFGHTQGKQTQANF